MVVLNCSVEGCLALMVALFKKGKNLFCLRASHSSQFIIITTDNFHDTIEVALLDLCLDGQVIFILNETRVLAVSHFEELPDLAFIVWLTSECLGLPRVGLYYI